MFNFKEIGEKNKIVDNAIKVLKSEFIGIDKQIDEIMYNVRTWYLYPQLQTRPLVVSIWGMSGCGKTSLVKRISELLNIEKDLVYWNFASISENSSWEIENQIEEELSNENSMRMFVYDEFQYAATINPKSGEERDNKSGLKPFWELLDSGILHKRSDFWAVQKPFRVLDYMSRINLKCKMDIKNGVWTNAHECLKDFSPYDITKFNTVFNFDINHETSNELKKIEKGVTERMGGLMSTTSQEGSQMPFFIKDVYLDKLLELYSKSSNSTINEIDVYHKMEEMDCDELVDFIYDIYENARKGYNLKFNDSIIFVIGNLDEAYDMSFNVNPDMSPDQFRKITEKISIVDIKDALKKRFRNEQIARLGNIHVIYPSFSQKNFEDIIQLSLDSYKDEVFKLTGYTLEFDESIKKIIYDEGVYPTHGTRPIFSTVQEIVKSRFPEIICGIYDKKIPNEVTNIVFCFESETNRIKIICKKENKEISTFYFDIKLRLKKLRDTDINDDEQALCALHESGHFVVYAKLFGKMPEKLVSRTAESNVGGFLMEDIDEANKKFSKRDLINKIKVLLGGYVAEKMFFGEEQSGGASSDLKLATQLASTIVRRYGMGSFTYVATNVEAEAGDDFGGLINEENQIYINKEIKDIITTAENDVRQTFMNNEWRSMLKESALYLCENSAMPKEKMQEIYDKVSDSVKMAVRSDKYYHDMIENI